MTYQPAVYRKQGGDELVVASSGVVTVESGGTVTIESGGNLTVDSGGTLTVTSGAHIYGASQDLTVALKATAITNHGVTTVVGATSGPIYTITAPTAGGHYKDIILSNASTADTMRALIYAGTTGLNFGSTAENQLALETTGCKGVSLRSISATAWRIVGFYPTAPALSAYSTP